MNNLIKLPFSRIQKCALSCQRLLHGSRVFYGAHDGEFAAAKERLGTLREDPGNEVKLKIYGLFKQATTGTCNVPKPGMMDFVGKAKWDAWNKLGDMNQDDAQQEYINLINSLVGSQPEETPQETAPGTMKLCDGLEMTREEGMNVIKFNRPNKKNAITVDMYRSMVKYLEEAAKDDSRICVITGAGDFYCSGNDLGNFANIDPSNMKQAAEDGGVVMEEFVAAFIDFPKPLIGIVNGPAIGIAVSSLGLMDVVYATDKATFQTPFTALGQSAEACSSITFPKLMGTPKANEMLLFNKKLSAQEACDRGLVAEIFPDHVFQQEVWERVKQYSKLPKDSMRLSKILIRSAEKEQLHQANRDERKLLVERWQSQECLEAIMNFFSK